MNRVGIGHDTHRLEAGRKLILGGILVEYPRGLAGHSDADIVLHALTDAILGAAGLGDIGGVFGVDDDEYSGANGEVFIKGALDLLAEHGWRVLNVAVQLVGNKPKVAPMRLEVEQALSSLIGAPVSVAATTTDGLGFLGDSQGVAAVATALIESRL